MMSRFRIDKENFTKIVKKAQTLYNRYRSPEARAKIISFSNNVLVVEFDGSFCETCGVNDWIDDFRFVLKDLGVEVVIERIEEIDDFTRIAYFKIVGIAKDHNDIE